MRTKIVCTLGPASDNEDVLRHMIRAGMDVARINFSHGVPADHARRIALVRRLAQEEDVQVALMGDLQGPKFRIGVLPEAGVRLEDGRRLILSARAPYSAESAPGVALPLIPMPHPDFISAMRPGQRLLVDDGKLVLRIVEEPLGDAVLCEVLSGGLLMSRKGVSAPGARFTMSALTPKDRADVQFAVEQRLDALALSFVRRHEHLVELRELTRSLGADPILVAKIEKPEALDDLPDILRATDVVMVARGDLGVEAPPEEVPFYQKTIIHSCLKAGVPVITATQMLQSMIESPSPTRAEASDIANAVLDGTDAVMLSGETAVGKYPVESVQAMATISRHAEAHGWPACPPAAMAARSTPRPLDMPAPDDVTEAITMAAVEIAEGVGAKAIVCTTTTGHTARMMARHRPAKPILALTPSYRTFQFTAFMWGVKAVLAPVFTSTDEMLAAAARV
ncbi:MAG: pyruvate kinase, partial [Anaerolineae bacterium]|nr:pyruvate kinase [Thermoflexales bacterium]MDW8408267.1 pyruvate kinase [Anaerolineae bacterium]